MTLRPFLSSTCPLMQSPAIERTVVALVALGLMLLLLGTGSLNNYDEAIYGDIAREMVERGDWMTTYWNQRRMIDKPPLTLWLMAGCVKLLGPTELAVRLPSALMGAATVVALYCLATRLFDRGVATIAAFVLLSTPHFYTYARMGNTDVPLTLFLTLAFYQFWTLLNGPSRKAPYIWLGLFMGLAALSKGAVCFVIPGVVGITLVVTGRFRQIWNPRWLLAALVFLIVAMPWHLVQYHLHGDEFVHDYVQHLFLARFGQTVDASPQPWWHYFEHMGKRARPYGFFAIYLFPVFLWTAFRQRSSAMALVGTWVLFVFIGFSYAQTKHHWYIIPLYPALAVALAKSALVLSRGRGLAAMQVGALVVMLGHMAFTGDVLNLDHTPEQKELGLYLRERTDPTDIIRLHLVRAPSVTFYSQRRCLQYSCAAGKKPFSQKNNAYPLRDFFVDNDRLGDAPFVVARPNPGPKYSVMSSFDATTFARFNTYLQTRYEQDPWSYPFNNGQAREHGYIQLYRSKPDR